MSDIERERTRLRKAADNFTDDSLLAKWNEFGKQCLAEMPEVFATTYETVLAGFAAETLPAAALVPTLENWEVAGRTLIATSDDERRECAFIAIGGLLMLAGERDRRGRS